MVIALISLGIIAILVLEFLILGKYFVWGPIRSYRNYKDRIKDIKTLYPIKENQGNIIFYGSSNFALWHSLDGDIKGYVVENHSLNKCIDVDLYKYLNQLIIPYNPKIIVFLTGSNDFTAYTGFNNERTEKIMKQKSMMFDKIHELLPNTKIVVLSSLYLPGRIEFLSLTKRVNQELKHYCSERDYMKYVDCDNLTYPKETFKKELFEKDLIILNRDGQIALANDYIIPCLEELEC